MFGRIVFNLTRGLTEQYNPEEPEFTTERQSLLVTILYKAQVENGITIMLSCSCLYNGGIMDRSRSVNRVSIHECTCLED